MDNVWTIIILVVILIYGFIVQPKLAQNSICKYVQAIDGEIISIRSISTRESLYLIKYKVNGVCKKSNVRCNFLGQIIEWI
ncbi:MAG: hypothetical protein E7231_03335 [Cellulosilyticum sp.]|nr:hypothetical protein [Cellulosilyticum sp.]